MTPKITDTDDPSFNEPAGPCRPELHVWFVHDFNSWAITYFDVNGDPQDIEYYAYKQDAVRRAYEKLGDFPKGTHVVSFTRRGEQDFVGDTMRYRPW